MDEPGKAADRNNPAPTAAAIQDYDNLGKMLVELTAAIQALEQKGPARNPNFFQFLMNVDPKHIYVRRLDAKNRQQHDLQQKLRFHPVALSQAAHQRRIVPVTVSAPIVTDARGGAQPLLNLIESLKNNDSAPIAKAEGRRLAPYMAGLSLYLTQAIRNTGPKDEKKLRSLTTPHALTGLFNAMAKTTHCTILSEVAVLPSNIKRVGPAAPLFKDKEFSRTYSYRGHDFSFGFLQVYDRGVAEGAYFSTTLPVMLLNHRMLSRLAPYRPAALLGSFQTVMTLVNHDMLHHFTSPLISNGTAHTIDAELAGPLDKWQVRLPKKAPDQTFYEEWALATHAQTLLAPGNEPMVQECHAHTDAYFTQLERIRNEMTEAGEYPRKIRDVVDYFGMVMAHALSRGFALNHPLMDGCIAHMERLDPSPGQVLIDCAHPIPPDDDDSTLMDTARCRETIRARIDADKQLAGIVAGYRPAGLDLLPRADADWTYGTIKRLQLCICSPGEVEVLTPMPGDRLQELRRKAGGVTLNMILAAAKSSGFKPS
jgi:hypothetical protein